MTPSAPTTQRPARGDSLLAFSIMFFSVALLCLLLGWADGVRHGKAYLHLPHAGSWMVATAILAALGVGFLLWSKMTKRS